MNLNDYNNAADAEKYQNDNGVVLRAILIQWKVAKFTWKDLCNTLAAYKLTRESVLEAMLNFAESEYIICKDRETNARIDLWDYVDELDDVSFMLGKKGRDIAYTIIHDPSINL